VSKAQFLPRDAMHKRGLCRHAVSVCLSVRPSVCTFGNISYACERDYVIAATYYCEIEVRVRDRLAVDAIFPRVSL